MTLTIEGTEGKNLIAIVTKDYSTVGVVSKELLFFAIDDPFNEVWLSKEDLTTLVDWIKERE